MERQLKLIAVFAIVLVCSFGKTHKHFGWARYVFFQSCIDISMLILNKIVAIILVSSKQ